MNDSPQTDERRIPPHEASAESSAVSPGTRFWSKEVLALGLVSFLTDLSSETIFAVLPVYFIQVAGGSAVLLGVMEGLADFSASSLDLVSGIVSDRTGQRKRIAMVGYGLSTIAKSLLLFVATAPGLVAFRVIERLGKSIRGAPRDALLTTISPRGTRGFSLGVHKAMDKSGAVLGPLLAYLVLNQYGAKGSTFSWLFIAAIIPAIVAVVVLGTCVRERKIEHRTSSGIRVTLSRFDKRYWWYMGSTAVFSLGYFSFAFLILKAQRAGFVASEQALLYGFFNLVFAVVSIPVGWIGDRLGRRTIVVASYLIYASMLSGFLLFDSPGTVISMFALYGVFYAMDEGQSKAYLADLSSEEDRATAIGFYGFLTGLMYLPASLIAGLLWSYGATWTFAFAIVTSLTAICVFLMTPQKPLTGDEAEPIVSFLNALSGDIPRNNRSPSADTADTAGKPRE